MKFTIDNTIVGLVIAKWKEDELGSEIFCSAYLEGNRYRLGLSFPVFGQYKAERMKIELTVKNGDMNGYRRGDEVTVNEFGLIKLGPNTWRLDPILMTQMIKAYIILVNVPEPAPWENVKPVEFLDYVDKVEN